MVEGDGMCEIVYVEGKYVDVGFYVGFLCSLVSVFVWMFCCVLMKCVRLWGFFVISGIVVVWIVYVLCIVVVCIGSCVVLMVEFLRGVGCVSRCIFLGWLLW